MGRFFSDVEDLLKRVTHMKDEDVARLRERVESSLGTARDAVSRNASRVRETAGAVVDSTDEYVRRRPWTVAGRRDGRRRDRRCGPPVVAALNVRS